MAEFPLLVSKEALLRDLNRKFYIYVVITLFSIVKRVSKDFYVTKAAFTRCWVTFRNG